MLFGLLGESKWQQRNQCICPLLCFEIFINFVVFFSGDFCFFVFRLWWMAIVLEIPWNKKWHIDKNVCVEWRKTNEWTKKKSNIVLVICFCVLSKFMWFLFSSGQTEHDEIQLKCSSFSVLSKVFEHGS